MKCQPISISEWEKIQHGSQTIIIARSFCQKQQGLQGTKILPDNTFILFLGMPAGTYFHTKNCFFPMDIISLDLTGKILAVWTASPGIERIGPTPNGTAKVVETHAGWIRKNNLKIGDMIPLVLV